ncbi:CaiB/BaiF CoA transferase family protein [Pararhizobium mangrovi]|uniref:CoA transferase n=1 Tax=Pararhizobium mangrovi TaxID=2590452 RepID=A0A506TXL2_9HYPH|nr:CoA transferase [Pararhizobium mangrovi]TPW26250.1 CoA transferase [Pararhizobium mangrovi]
MTETLQSIRVLDLTNVLAGPFCCHQLSHMGAEVIKVEAPGRGDLARQLGADAGLNDANMGVSFLAQNAGKKSVTINLKSPEGKEVLRRLVATADVLVENYRPGVMDRLGVGYETLRTVNPRLIYCAISGFGQDGDWSDRPAYDQIIQGASGVMSITGDEATAPLRVGYPIADTIGGMTAAFAIASALNAKERGTFIDVSMLEAVLATMGWAVSNWLIAGVPPTANGNENLTSAPSGAFAAEDGVINIAANKDEQWNALVRHIDRADLLSDERFATREHRKANRFALRDELEKSLKTRPAAEWVDELNAIGVPAGPILSVPQVLDHPLIRERGMVETFPSVPGVDRPVSVVGPGMKFDGKAPTVNTPPPTLGQDNTSILEELGYRTDEIDHLYESGAV